MDGLLTVVLFLGICVGMHFFMHRGHGHQHRGHATKPQPSSEDGEESRNHRTRAGHGCH